MVTGIHISDDGETMLSVSKDCSIHFISLKYRIPISFITRKQPILCLALISENSTIITGEHQLIYIQDNPLVSNRIRILGPEENIQKFLTYMKNIVSGKFIQHDLTMDKFMILPFFFNTLHFYSFLGLRDHLVSSLVETATIYPSKNGYHPLYIALIKGMKGIRDDIIDALISLGTNNPFLYQSIENIIIKMNSKAFPKLGELYEAIYQPVLRISLPKFCSPEIELPVVHIAAHPRVRVDDFFSPDDIGNHGQGILFKESYVKIDYVMGSKESIEFLESLANCTNLDVMRSTLIQALIAYK